MYRIAPLACAALIGGALASFASLATAQATYPRQPIRLTVPFAPGIGTDALARAIAPKLAAAVGQSVIVDNRTDGNTRAATAATARAAPDGHTVLLYTNEIGGSAAPNTQPDDDPLRDLIPVSLLVRNPHVLVVHPSVPARSFGELVKIAKARPKLLNFGATGSGTVNQLGADLFTLLTGADITHVPHKGSGLPMAEILSGQIDLLFAALPAISQHVRADRLRALALTTAKRLHTLPELPTIAELGYPEYELATWFGVLAPENTPRDAIDALGAALAKALRHPDLQPRLVDYELLATDARAFAAFLKIDVARTAKIMRAARTAR